VPDARRAGEGLLAERGIEVRELPDGAEDLDAAPVVNGEPGGVVPAVLEATEPLDQQGGALRYSDVTNDSAHGSYLRE
jgi:hypothetical protein